jgi:hypothetical protein
MSTQMSKAWQEESAPGGSGALANMAAQLQGRRPHGTRETEPRPLTALRTGRTRGSGVGPVRSAAALSVASPGLPGATSQAGPRAAEPGPGEHPPPAHSARSTLACSRAGAQARQVQVPLRCAEGTYSWCSRLLAVSHTRK